MKKLNIKRTLVVIASIIIIVIIIILIAFFQNNNASCITLKNDSKDKVYFCLYEKGDKFMLVNDHFFDVFYFNKHGYFDSKIAPWGSCNLSGLDYDKKYIQEVDGGKHGFYNFEAISHGYTEIIAKGGANCDGKTMKFKIFISLW